MARQLKDSDLREATHRQLLRHARQDPNTLVIDELGLSHGACRVDIAVINGHIHGVELKAEADTLQRLPHQIAAYGDVVDRATLIVAERHIEAALAILPTWWGVVVARRTAKDGVRFQRLRPDRVNRHANPMTIARLLWRSEAAALLRERGHAETALNGTRATLYAQLVAELPRRELSRAVRETLKTRAGWRDREPLS